MNLGDYYFARPMARKVIHIVKCQTLPDRLTFMPALCGKIVPVSRGLNGSPLNTSIITLAEDVRSGCPDCARRFEMLTKVDMYD